MPIVLLSAYSEMPASLLWLVDEYVMKSEPIERLPEVIGKVVSARKASPKSDPAAPLSFDSSVSGTHLIFVAPTSSDRPA